MAIYANISIDQGSDFSAVIGVQGADGLTLDLTGFTSRGQIRKTYTSRNSISFTTSIPDPTSGNIQISLTNIQTATMKPGRYLYDVEIISTDNLVTRVVEGQVDIDPRITLPDNSHGNQIFTTDGTWVVPANVNSVNVLVVGGGGGGGNWAGGGGGGGGVIRDFDIGHKPFTVIPNSSISITIGAGGLGANAYGTVGTQGGNTSFGTLVALGGGYGGSGPGSNLATGGNGGSGGGAYSTGSSGLGTEAQGEGGGLGYNYGGGAVGPGGGGGGGAVDGGGSVNGNGAGSGGTGYYSMISGDNIMYGSGGGGGAGLGAIGGQGSIGAGNGGNRFSGGSDAVIANVGAGGGGGGDSSIDGGNGSAGVVIITW